MKISCQCGGLIVDQSDFLPYKAYLIADQDWFDVLDERGWVFVEPKVHCGG